MMKQLKLIVLLVLLASCSGSPEQKASSLTLELNETFWMSDNLQETECEFDPDQILGAWIMPHSPSPEMYTEYYLDNGLYVMYGKILWMRRITISIPFA